MLGKNVHYRKILDCLTFTLIHVLMILMKADAFEIKTRKLMLVACKSGTVRK